MAHIGYDYFTPDPGKEKEMSCLVCGTNCNVERNFSGYRSFASAVSRHKSNFDRFICPNAGLRWHDDVIELMKEHDNTRSKRLKRLLSKMEQLADKGNGNYAYLDSIREAKKVLVSELAGTLLTIAKDVKIQIEFNPAKVKAYRLIGYENRILAKEDFADDTKDAGELGAGHSVTALYEIIPVEADEATRPTPELKYQETDLSAEAEQTNELMTVKLRYKRPDEDESILMVHPVLDESISFDQASDNFKFSTWRKCWTALAESQMELGFKQISKDMIEELKKAQNTIDYEVAKEKEKSSFSFVLSSPRLLNSVFSIFFLNSIYFPFSITSSIFNSPVRI